VRAFSNLGKLEELCLSSNQIDVIDERLLSGSVSLKKLDLQKNKLRSIPARAFINLNQLTDLKLDVGVKKI
jgi:Leucine-rich repeat (LRR) protein